jgi:hypothetical protein
VIPWEVEKLRGSQSRCGDVVIGTLLGDGCLERNGRNVRLRIDHGIRQRALVDWKHRELAELDPSAPRLVERLDPRTGLTQSNYRFTTRSVAVLNDYYLLLYGKGSKSIPEQMRSILISPLSLAVWYMDDGSRRGDCRSGYLNTNSFRVEEVSNLRDCLRRNFNIVTRTHFARGRPRIYIPQASFSGFCDMIRPHVIDEMRYKLL